MKNNVVATLVAVLALFVVFATAANPSECSGFRITSPTQPGLQWTEGQCYAVSFDGGASKVNSVNAVDLYPVGGTKKVSRQWRGSVPPSSITTGNFNLYSNHKTGDFYFRVWASTTNGKVCRFNTVSFHVTYNPNSPPAKC